MIREKWNYQETLIAVFLLSVFLLALSKIHDWDAWMHLSMGRMLWEHKGFPPYEPFVYTMADKPFVYTSWLFGIIYYAAYQAFNVSGVILLKALTVTTVFFILVRDSLRPYRNYVITVIVMAVVVVLSRHRFVERPDTFLMVFLTFSIFSLNAFIHDNKKYIYALPFTHMLWANSHSSINLMFIPFLSFIVGGYLQHFIAGRGLPSSRTPSAAQIKTIMIIFGASFAASLISPYFISQYTFGVQVIATDWIKQEIIEVRPPTWETYKAPFILAPVVVLSFIVNWVIAYHRSRSAKNESPVTARSLREEEGSAELSIVHFFLVMPFIVLSFTAYRFIFLSAIVSGPVIAKNLSSVLLSLSNKENRRSKVDAAPFPLPEKAGRNPDAKFSSAVAAFLLVFFTILTLLNVTPFGNKEKVFGFGIHYDYFPEGAFRFMDKRNISGRVFNTFQFGQYIVWRDFPGRTPFIDGRVYIEPDLLEKMDMFNADAAVLDDLYRRYGFESVLIAYPGSTRNQSESLPGTDIALPHPGWALVYWDDLVLLYLKRDGKYASVVQEDEYRFLKPANGISGLNSWLQSRDPSVIPGLIAELKRNIAETGSSRGNAFLGYVYNAIGSYREAIDVFSEVREFHFMSYLPQAHNGIAQAHAALGNTEESIQYYKKALALKKHPTILYSIGNSYFKLGDKSKAVEYFEQALDLDSNLLPLYPSLISLYHELGRADDEMKTKEMYKKAEAFADAEEMLGKGIQAYVEQNLQASVEFIKRSIQIYPSNPSAYNSLGNIYYEMGAINLAQESQKKTIELNPDHANAHYSLALIYKSLGDLTAAKDHWREYLRIEPAGYYSRRAQEEIDGIKSSR